jgi:hypothetical protein
MTNSEFESLFHKVHFSLPDYIVESINRYTDNRITVSIDLSDELVDKAERKFYMAYPSAFLLPSDTHWHFTFRQRVLDAPLDVLTSIIRHEIIHGFLISARFTHLRNARVAINDFERELKKVDSSYRTLSSSDKEERLTSFINKSLGGVEDEARKLEY